MNGENEYKEQNKKKIENKIHNNSDIPYIEDYYYYVKTNKTLSTVYNYINYVINFLRFTNVDNPSNIKLLDYTKYMASLDDETPSYQIAVYSALKTYSEFLYANKLNDHHMTFVKRPKFYETQETKIRRENSYLTKDEVDTVLSSILSSDTKEVWKARDYAIILMLLTSGIRCSALFKLDIKSIDLNKGAIYVHEKGDNVREIFIPSKTVDAVSNWMKLRNINVADKNEALFISNQRSRLNQRSIYRITNKYGYIEGKTVHPHIFRSTFGSFLHEMSNGDLYFVQECMGHSNPKTTELYIRGRRDNIKEKARCIMSNYF